MDDVIHHVIWVIWTTLGGAGLIHNLQPPNVHGGADSGPNPGHAHEEYDCPELEGLGQRVHDGEILVHADVHKRMDGRNETETVHPTIELAHGATPLPEDPTVVDHGRDGEWHHQDGHKQIGDRQIDQKQVGASSHPSVTDDDSEDHCVAQDGHQRSHNENGCDGGREGPVPLARVFEVCAGRDRRISVVTVAHDCVLSRLVINLL